ncbi:MAG: MFS transporter [Limisphaerales bacterium]
MSIRFKLFVMMVLEFFIWGAWLPLIFGYLPGLGFSPLEQALILNAFPIAAIVGCFSATSFATAISRRKKFLGFSHLVGGLAMIGLTFTKTFWPFFGLMLVHCLLYVPTISIVNSIAFANMKDSKREFGLVRVGGTIGWILAAWPFTFILVDWDKVHAANTHGLVEWLGAVLGSGLSGEKLKAATAWTFTVAGIASLLLAAFSFVLPHTPRRKPAQVRVKNWPGWKR